MNLSLKLPPLGIYTSWWENRTHLHIVRDYFAGKEGVVLTVNRKEKVIEELREKGLANEKFEKDYGFPYIMKLCREYKVCDFKTITIGKNILKMIKGLKKN